MPSDPPTAQPPDSLRAPASPALPAPWQPAVDVLPAAQFPPSNPAQQCLSPQARLVARGLAVDASALPASSASSFGGGADAAALAGAVAAGRGSGGPWAAHPLTAQARRSDMLKAPRRAILAGNGLPALGGDVRIHEVLGIWSGAEDSKTRRRVKVGLHARSAQPPSLGGLKPPGRVRPHSRPSMFGNRTSQTPGSIPSTRANPARSRFPFCTRPSGSVS